MALDYSGSPSADVPHLSSIRAIQLTWPGLATASTSLVGVGAVTGVLTSSALVVSLSAAGTAGAAATTSGLSTIGMGLGMAGGVGACAMYGGALGTLLVAAMVQDEQAKVKWSVITASAVGGIAASGIAYAAVSGAVITSTLATLGGGAVAAGGLGMAGGIVAITGFGLLAALICGAVVWCIWWSMGETGKSDDPTTEHICSLLCSSADFRDVPIHNPPDEQACEDLAFHCDVCGYRLFAPSSVVEITVFSTTVLCEVKFCFDSSRSESFNCYHNASGWSCTPFLIPFGEYITQVRVRDQEVTYTRGIQFITNKGTKSEEFRVRSCWNNGKWRTFSVPPGQHVVGLHFDDEGKLAKLSFAPLPIPYAAKLCLWCTAVPFEKRVDGILRNAYRLSLPLATEPDVCDTSILEAAHTLGPLGALAAIYRELKSVDSSKPWYQFWSCLGQAGIERTLRLIAAQLLLSESSSELGEVLQPVSACLSKTGQQKWGVPYAFIIRDMLVATGNAIDRVAHRKDVADARSFFDLPASATERDIIERYRLLSRKFHPDRVRSESKRACATVLQAYLNEARELLLHLYRHEDTEQFLALMDEDAEGKGLAMNSSFMIESENDIEENSSQQHANAGRMKEETCDGHDGMVVWIEKIRVARNGLQQAIKRQLTQEVAFNLIRRYEIVFEQRGQCFLPDTMLWISPSESRQVTSLREGDRVLNIYGTYSTIIIAFEHEEELRTLVQLKTREASLKVTADHRIPVQTLDGQVERLAGELSKGDEVLCGQNPVPLVSVSSHRMHTRVVQLGFLPDAPLEAFRPPRHGLASYGQASYPDTDDDLNGL